MDPQSTNEIYMKIIDKYINKLEKNSTVRNRIGQKGINLFKDVSFIRHGLKILDQKYKDIIQKIIIGQVCRAV